MTKIAIIGAGISGLSLAWYLQKFHQNGSITLFEKENRYGGMIETSCDPFFFEKGPRTFSATRCKELLDLIHAIGLEEEILFSDRSAHKRWIYENGAFRSPIPFWLGVKALCADLFYKAPSLSEDLSVSEFFSYRFGSEFVERCIDPMVSGIYASDVNSLSIEMAFPSLWKIQKKYSSLLIGMKKGPKSKGPSGLFTLRSGLKVLTERLSENLDIIYGSNPKIKEQGRVIEDRGKLFEFDHIFVTSDPRALFEKEIPPLCVTYNPLVTVNCGYESQGFSKKGFGYLIPSKEKEPILGCVFDSMIFPEQNIKKEELRFTLMMGGAHGKDIMGKTDPEILEISRSVIRKHLGLSDPDFMKISHYEKAIASYPVGFANEKKRWIELMQESYPSLHFIWNGLGDPAVNGRVRAAKECALAFCRS